MALNPEEQESQIVVPPHSPPPEQDYLDDAFPGGADGYHDPILNEEQYLDSDDVQMVDVSSEADEVISNTQLMSHRYPSHTSQQDSHNSLVEQTQFADIERDTQAIQSEKEPVQKDTQNVSLGSRSFIEETQFAGIEMDTQAIEDTTQSDDTFSSFQKPHVLENDGSAINVARQTKMSPPKLFSRPVEPKEAPFRYFPAPPVRRNHGSAVQNASASRALAQTTERTPKVLSKVTPIPELHGRPSINPVRHTQKANPGDNSASATHSIPDVRIRLSVKPIGEREVVPVVENMPSSQHLLDTHNIPLTTSTRPPKSVALPDFNAPRHHQMSNVLPSPSDKPALEQIPPPTIQNTAINEQFSDTCNLPLPNWVHSPRGLSSVLPNKFQHHQIPDSNSVLLVKACGSKEAVRPIVQDHSAIHPPIQEPTKGMACPPLQTEGIISNPNDITPRSTSHNEVASFSKSNNIPVLNASQSGQSKLVGLPPSQPNAVTPTHYAGRPRRRQKSSNQMNRSGVSKISVYGNLVKKPPFPDALADESKLQVHGEISNKIEVPVPQPQCSEPHPTDKELPKNRIEAATVPESQRLRTNDRRIQRETMTQSVTNADPLSVSEVQVLDNRTEDSKVNPVEYEDNSQVEDSEEFNQSISSPNFRPGHPVTQIDRHSPAHRVPLRTVSRANISRPHTPRSQTTPRTQGAHEAHRKSVNRPIKPHDLEPQEISELTSSHFSVSKVTKSAAVHSQDEKNKTGDHVSSCQNRSSLDFGALHWAIAECQTQQIVIKDQENQVVILNAQLRDAEARLQDTNLLNEELETSKGELSKRVERLNHLSNSYREHINGVVICQKSLRQDSKEMKESMGNLKAKSQEIRNIDAQMKKMRRLLDEIKQVRKEQSERDKTIPTLEALNEQNDQLRSDNERLRADYNSKLVELEEERCHIEQLENQINGDMDRHKEVMEILQKPQVDTLGELTKEDGILKKVLISTESVNGKFDEMTKTFASSFNQTLEWPQTMTKILEEFYSRIETKLDDNGSGDTIFQESTVKLFDDLKERLNQLSGDMDEKTKLNEQINTLRETNATFMANLSSKEADLENNIARMNELTRELADAHSELMGKTQQLAISLAEPRENPELKRKVEELTTETSRLEGLLTAANHDKHQAEKEIQAHQTTITTIQKQLRDMEEKFRGVKSTIEALEVKNQKSQMDCVSTTERVRQETTRLALFQRKQLLAQHDSLVNDLKHKQAETEKRLQTAIEESKTFKDTNDKQTKTISELESKIATCKDQLLQQITQLQSLEERFISPQFQKLKQEHKQVVLSIRKEQENQHASSQAFLEESFRVKGELEGAQRRLREMHEENEHLTKEIDRLRKRLDDINAMTESTQNMIGSSHRVDDIRPISRNDNRSSSRKPAERRSSSLHYQTREKGMGENQHRVREIQTDEVKKTFSRTLSSSQTYGDNRGGSQTPIKPFSTIATVATSPLTDLEDVMPLVRSANCREDLQRVYSKNRQLSNDNIVQMESRSKYYHYGEEHLGTPKSKINKVMLTLEGEFVNTPTQASRTILSVAEESVQRRTNKPLKSALKKGDHQDYSVPHDASQDQVQNQDERLFKKPAPRNNHGASIGLQATRGTGTGSYNRIASGVPKGTSSRTPEPRYEPTPEIKRNAMKRARSNSSIHTQDLQPTNPAKAPRINRRQPINKTIIPDSQ